MSPQDTEHADHKRTFDLLREIGRFNHIGGWVYHPKTSTLRWTSVTYDIFGIDGSVKPGPYDAIEYFHPENRVAVEAAFRQALRDGTPYDFDLQITRPDGGTIWLSASGRAVMRDGAVDYLYGSFQNIDERKRNELALIESESRYRSIFDNISDVYFRSDVNGILTEITPSIFVHSGYPREEILNRPVSHFYYSEENFRAVNRLLLKDGRVSDFKIRLKTKDGEEVYTSVNATLTYDEKGKMNGVEGVLRNVIDRIRNERMSEERVRRFRATFNSSFQLAAMLNLNGVITDINNNAIKFSRSDSIIRLSVVLGDGFTRFSVQDFGVGMSMEKMSRIWDSAFESEPGTAGERGSGVGLNLCKTYVENHGGQICVESEVGVGTTFHFPIPDGQTVG